MAKKSIVLKPGMLFYATNKFGLTLKYMYVGKVKNTGQGSRLLFCYEYDCFYTVEDAWAGQRKIKLVKTETGNIVRYKENCLKQLYFKREKK